MRWARPTPCPGGLALVWTGLWLTACAVMPRAEPSLPHPGELLFERADLIALEFEAPFGSLALERFGKSDYHTGELRYREVDGREVVIPLEVRTRGKTRRRKEFCSFPPLRLRFEPDATRDTLFAGLRTLKLVTHCRNSESYEQLVLQEYLAYRVYNQLTDRSHRVRLAEVTYLESGGRPRTTRYGILLEDWRSVASRNGLTPAEVSGGVNIEKLSPPDMNRVAVFQYMISNEDWSALWPEPDEDCCHNTKPLLSPDGWVVPLPYDFDFAGIVNAPYAIPKPPSRSVRVRQYRGLCLTQSTLPDALALFREQREAIYALYRNQPGITPGRLSSTLAYLDRFYEVIDDPEQVERRMIRRCKKD